MKLPAYYIAHIAANVTALLVFSEHIEINAGSLAPIAIIAIMLFQALFAFGESREVGETAFSEENRLSEEERIALNKHLRTVFLLLIPFAIPFLFFFSVYAKLLVILLYFLAYVIGGVSFRLAHGKRISARLDTERAELESQRKKEERGEI